MLLYSIMSSTILFYNTINHIRASTSYKCFMPPVHFLLACWLNKIRRCRVGQGKGLRIPVWSIDRQHAQLIVITLNWSLSRSIYRNHAQLIIVTLNWSSRSIDRHHAQLIVITLNWSSRQIGHHVQLIVITLNWSSSRSIDHHAQLIVITLNWSSHPIGHHAQLIVITCNWSSSRSVECSIQGGSEPLGYCWEPQKWSTCWAEM